jgi:hypothetical protein
MESQSYGSLDELHDAIGVPKKSNNKAWQAAKAEALQTLAQLRAYDESQHPRDETGKWTDSGGGGDGAGGAAASDKDKPASVDHLIEPHVVDVGGDKWNQITAYNLERDYQTARPAIEHLEQKAIGAVEDTSGDDGEEDDHSDYVPEEWDAMSEAAQEQAGEEYESKYYDEYLQSEQDNWSTEYAPDEARVKVAEDFNEGNASDDIEWAQDALADVRAERDDSGKPPIPFTEKQLIDAIHIDYEDQSASWPKKDVEINFDDGLLTKPAGYDPAQATLPGIEKIEPHEMLTEDMRTEIAVALTKAFEKRADDVANDLEPPDYLADQAKEQVKEGWDSMSDSDKFAWTESNTSILSTDKGGGQEDSSIVASLDNAKLDRLPTKYDPLNDTSGDDYRRTQILARYLSRERTKEIMAARDIEAPTDKDLREADNELWKSWKESSTSEDGKLIQLATAEELGGRLNSHTRAAIEPAKAKARADRIFPFIGGYDGVKALIRAKWEVTQYLLDKADKDELELYRGMTLDKMLVEKIFKHAESGKRVGSFTHLPTMDVKRNGAASTTTALTVANGWGGGGAGKVTLRAIVPRTAAVSIPAYGINIKSEQEVVVAGTAWKGWDVWQGQAPGFTSTPLQKHV